MSLALLAGATVGWSTLDRDGGADLVGAAVTESSATAPSSGSSPASPGIAAVDDGSTLRATSTLPPSLRQTRATPPGVPVAISIPALGVDDAVTGVGFGPDGTMQVPGVEAAGWWSPGPRPGATHGSSVIAAHVDFDGRPGVFRDLQRLEIGHEVLVTDDAGRVYRFTVAERFQVAKGELPRAELFRTGGPPVLTLVTCGGLFRSESRHYADNIVVRALPVARASASPKAGATGLRSVTHPGEQHPSSSTVRRAA